MSIPPALRALLAPHGPPGYETAPAAAFREAVADFAEVTTDVMGSVWARVPGTADGPTLAIVGHLDEIGLTVTHIDDGGFLRFAGHGWDPQIVVGQRVSVSTRDGIVPGVIGRKPIHLLKEDDRKKVARLEELHIDIGAADGEQARRMARVGDVAVIAGDPVELPNGRAVARAMDNRLGCYVACEAARVVHSTGGTAGDVVAVGAVQEEVTFAGARTSAYALRPDVAIVVDVTHATDAPGIDVNELGVHPLGSGPVLERGVILNPRVFELLHDTADAEGIAVTIAASARATATDADVIHISRAGIPCATVGIPLRYMHSPVEMVSLDDVAAAARLIAAFARRLTAGTSFAR
jgi:putative aminopeptidase FrvX